MKNTILIAAISIIPVMVTGQIVITGIIDGPRTGGTPKAIELYVSENIADLSSWDVQNYNNGGTTAGNTFALSGSATAGTFLYVASESAEFNNFFGFTPSFTTGALGVNGDDVVVIRNSTNIIDAFGVIGVDPDIDTTWNYQDAWFYRNNGTPASSTFTLANWTPVSGQSDGLDSLGTSGTNATAGALAFPVGTYTPVPEPSTYAAILGALVLALGIIRRRK